MLAVNREKQILEKKLQHSNLKFNQIQSELKEEKDLREALQQNQISWQSKHKQLQDEYTEYKNIKENEFKDMQEQIRDLMFFLDAQKQIENSSEKNDISGGTIIVPETSNAVKPTRSRKQHRKH